MVSDTRQWGDKKQQRTVGDAGRVDMGEGNVDGDKQ